MLSLANGVTGVLRPTTPRDRRRVRGGSALEAEVWREDLTHVDRFLSNTAIDVARLTPSLVKFVLGARNEIVVALDWADFEKDDHGALCAYAVTSHGCERTAVGATACRLDSDCRDLFADAARSD